MGQKDILSMNDFPGLMSYLPYGKRKEVAVKIAEAVVHRH